MPILIYQNLLEEFANYNNCSGSKDTIIVLTNDTFRCDGCNANTNISNSNNTNNTNINITNTRIYFPQNLTFLDNTTKPIEYYLAAGCLNKKRFVFSHIHDKSGVHFVSYRQGDLDFNERCLNRSLACAGNSNNTFLNGSSYCPKTYLNSNCLLISIQSV